MNASVGSECCLLCGKANAEAAYLAVPDSFPLLERLCLLTGVSLRKHGFAPYQFPDPTFLLIPLCAGHHREMRWILRRRLPPGRQYFIDTENWLGLVSEQEFIAAFEELTRPFGTPRLHQSFGDLESPL